MDQELYDKLDQYYEKFGDVFPTMRYQLSKTEMIKLMGHYQYYGITDNSYMIGQFCLEIKKHFSSG